MKTALKLSAYGAALAVLVAGTYAVGTAVGPVSDGSPARARHRARHVDDHAATIRRPRTRRACASTATDTPSSPTSHVPSAPGATSSPSASLGP